MSFILIYVPHKNEEQAKKITSHLLEKKPIACANFFPISSSYWWKGKIDNTSEIVTLLKKNRKLEKSRIRNLKNSPLQNTLHHENRS